MGNYKLVSFEGRADKAIDETSLLAATEFSVEAVTVKSTPTDDGGFDVIGCVNSCSMRFRVEPIAELMTEGVIFRADTDWSDVQIYEVANGVATLLSKYGPLQ